MSSKRMKTLDLPGLDDTYTFVQADSTLAISGEAADAAVVGAAVSGLQAAVSGLQATDTALTRQLGQVVTETVNLYDKTARTVGSSINSSGEVVEGSTIYDTSDYIPVTPGVTYIGKVYNDGVWATGPFSANGYYATYKSDKTFIARLAASALIDGIIPGETVAYIRVQIRKDSIASAPEYAVIADSAHFPAGYVAYGEHGYIYAAALATQAELDAVSGAVTAKEIPDSPTTDGLYLLQRSSGANAYTEYADEITKAGSDGTYAVKQTSGALSLVAVPAELPTLPTDDGTYHLVCTVEDGTAVLSWESTATESVETEEQTEEQGGE